MAGRVFVRGAEDTPIWPNALAPLAAAARRFGAQAGPSGHLANRNGHLVNFGGWCRARPRIFACDKGERQGRAAGIGFPADSKRKQDRPAPAGQTTMEEAENPEE